MSPAGLINCWSMNFKGSSGMHLQYEAQRTLCGKKWEQGERGNENQLEASGERALLAAKYLGRVTGSFS